MWQSSQWDSDSPSVRYERGEEGHHPVCSACQCTIDGESVLREMNSDTLKVMDRVRTISTLAICMDICMKSVTLLDGDVGIGRGRRPQTEQFRFKV